MEMIESPKCECGCGKNTTWNKRKKIWNKRLLGHYERTQEIKTKLSRFQKKRGYFAKYNKTEEHSKKVIQSNQTRVVTEKTKRKIAAALTGHKRSEKSILKGKITAIDNNSHLGKNNSNWKGGISARKNIGIWIKLSREIKKRDKYTCQKCASKINIDVHHIDFDKNNHEPLNLISLCRKCHFKKHKAHKKEII